ncbi:MAG TPA: ABC transporter permease [Thermoclostridium caenicola]|uniref:Sodium transport system permease protein n=1 Tax=Thermoclostridium caenicola TaxID=659425 RepID=A0A1M6BNG0_9FIRM|nr:ABC transporter permease [Thermoclostridium caenicola]SHI50291.1 sodium transport system permease protein [Thermoclostridium caenicola]HOK42262.1 ABC transporter permease [Thermoclostridium caenicola]HPO75975.1 ABC transporter permease [Thermoclostridium caenicola]
MNWKHVMIVFKKELKDIVRDRKTLFTSIILPIFLMPLLFLLIGGGTEKMSEEMTTDITVALTADSYSEAAQWFLKESLETQDEDITIIEPVADPWEAINSKQAKLVVSLDRDFKKKLEALEAFTLKVYYDGSLSRSGGAVGSLMSAIDKLNEGIAVKRLEAMGINPQILTPVLVETENISRTGDGNILLMMVLPMLIAMLVAVGGIPAATDLVAGEKERMTFEPLLATRPSRMSILMGKYLTINLFSFASVIATLTGMLLAFFINPDALSMGMGEIGGFNLDTGTVILCIAVTILLGMTFSGIQLAISTYARSFKEGQTYLSLLMFVVIIPAYATMMVMPNDIQLYMYLIPVLNTISAFKLVLGGLTNYTGLILAMVTSLVYVVLSLLTAAAMFRNEKYLFRS